MGICYYDYDLLANHIVKILFEGSDYTGPYYGAIKTDGRGRILSPSNVVEFISPEIIIGISEIKEEGVKHTKIDYSRIGNGKRLEKFGGYELG